MGISQNGVIRRKTMNVQVLPSDHKKLKHLALDLNISLKSLVGRLIDDHKELNMIKKAQ